MELALTTSPLHVAAAPRTRAKATSSLPSDARSTRLALRSHLVGICLCLSRSCARALAANGARIATGRLRVANRGRVVVAERHASEAAEQGLGAAARRAAAHTRVTGRRGRQVWRRHQRARLVELRVLAVAHGCTEAVRGRRRRRTRALVDIARDR